LRSERISATRLLENPPPHSPLPPPPPRLAHTRCKCIHVGAEPRQLISDDDAIRSWIPHGSCYDTLHDAAHHLVSPRAYCILEGKFTHIFESDEKGSESYMTHIPITSVSRVIPYVHIHMYCSSQFASLRTYGVNLGAVLFHYNPMHTGFPNFQA